MPNRSRFFLATAQQRIGEKIGVSPWVFIDQTQVNVFGEVTRWRTPGHCEPEYAKNTPYGGTLLHGFHAISLITHFYRSSELGLGWPRPMELRSRQGAHLQPIIIGDGIKLRSQITLLEARPKRSGHAAKDSATLRFKGQTSRLRRISTYWHAAS